MVNTHTFTRTWGDDFMFNPIDNGQKGRITGWKRGIAKDDYLILQVSNGTTRYQVDEIKYYADPPDMFQAQVTFAPRPR